MSQSDPQVILMYHFTGIAEQFMGIGTGNALPIGDFRPVISFCLIVAVWLFDNSFDLGHFFLYKCI